MDITQQSNFVTVSWNHFRDRQPVDLLSTLQAAGAPLTAEIGWQPTLHGPLDEAQGMPARVRASAGAGRLWTSP